GRTGQDSLGTDHRPPEHLRSRHLQALRRVQATDGVRPLVRGPSGGNPPADGVGPMDTDFGTTSAVEAEAMEVDEAPASRDWRVQYLDWMVRGVLPSDRAQARRLARRAKSFVLIDNELHKRSPS